MNQMPDLAASDLMHPPLEGFSLTDAPITAFV